MPRAVGWLDGAVSSSAALGAVVGMTGVDVVRGETYLLRGVDWTVEADHRWVILGPNGAGKTTLLQLAAAQMHPTRGEVHLLGETLGAVDVFELRPRIGLTSAALAQRIAPSETTGDIVVSAGYAVVGRWRERYDVHDLTRAGMLMQQWGVAQFAHRPFGTLSEGERKRAQIARALMPDPELLLLDEPGAGLDLGGREDLVARLSDLARYHYAPAQVLVTHHVEEIPPGYTHALLLREGRMVAAGPADDVLTADALSETFGLSLSLTRTDGRFTARRAA
jgi:iron complex transport system ATP-binding protein